MQAESIQPAQPTTTIAAWQTVLHKIIKVPAERQRLATALGITPMTLTRWANENTKPQRAHLVRLVQMVQAQDRQELLQAIEQNYPDIHNWLQDESPDQVPSAFIAQLLQTRGTVIDSLYFHQISDMVLKQALAQLDPNGLGMSLTIAQCMPPSEGGKIRSLRERIGRGTPPWIADLEPGSIFLGMESLAGYVVQYRRPASVEDLNKDQYLPAYQSTSFEISAAAHPIWQEGCIAGCLLASSTQIAYFTQQRLTLLGAFSNIISMAFNNSEFYSPGLVDLRFMPDARRQRPYLADFRRRVSETIAKARQNHEHLDYFQAEQLVWQELEAILLALPDTI